MIRCLFRYSTDAGTSSWLWSFNPLLLRLLGEISLSLLCSHSSRGSALHLDPPLRVGHLRASVLCSDRTGLKEQLIRGLWLTQAGGREGYGSYNSNAGWACSRGWRDVATAWGAPCVLPGKLSLIPGPWQWRAAQAPGRGGVESDLCLHKGFLLATAAALVSHAHLWGLRW